MAREVQVPDIPPFSGGGFSPEEVAAAGPPPGGPAAEAFPDGYCRYSCPACGGTVETTLVLKGVRFRCAPGSICGRRVRWYLPLTPASTGG